VLRACRLSSPVSSMDRRARVFLAAALLALAPWLSPQASAAPQVDAQAFVAIAAERAGRVELLGERRTACAGTEPPAGCRSGSGPLVRVRSYRVPAGPHNMAAHGSVVIVTHPRGGQVTRIDVSTGEVRSTAAGTAPHDVKFAGDGRRAFVADEAGRRVLVLDPDTLETRRTLPMPGRPHDLIVDGDDLWVTLVGRTDLARVRGSEVRLFPTGMRSHDLLRDGNGRLWFSNWNSRALGIFDPASGKTARAPPGVAEPHHFALAADGTVWVSDNGGASVVGFRPGGGTARIDVGAAPHHMAFLDGRLVVAVSGSGEAVVVEAGNVVERLTLSRGLHGAAAVQGMARDDLQGVGAHVK